MFEPEYILALLFVFYILPGIINAIYSAQKIFREYRNYEPITVEHFILFAIVVFMPIFNIGYTIDILERLNIPDMKLFQRKRKD